MNFVRVILQWLREDFTVLRQRPFFAIGLVLLGILIGYMYQAVFDRQIGSGSIRTPRYRDLTNTELKQKVMDLVVPFRSFANAAKSDSTELPLACDREMGKASTNEARTEMKKQCDEKSLRLTEKHIAMYNERFKSEAIFLREEMLRRLPPDYRSKIAPAIFWDYPTNYFGFDMVATSLELLHKSLPDG